MGPDRSCHPFMVCSKHLARLQIHHLGALPLLLQGRLLACLGRGVAVQPLFSALPGLQSPPRAADHPFHCSARHRGVLLDFALAGHFKHHDTCYGRACKKSIKWNSLCGSAHPAQANAERPDRTASQCTSIQSASVHGQQCAVSGLLHLQPTHPWLLE